MKLTKSVSPRVTPRDLERGDALAARFHLLRAAVLRSALRLGLEALERDPSRIHGHGLIQRDRRRGRRKSQ